MPPDQAAGAPDPSFVAAGDGRVVIPGASAGDATVCGADGRWGRLHGRHRGELCGNSSPTACPTRASLPAASRTSTRLRTSTSAALVLPSPDSAVLAGSAGNNLYVGRFLLPHLPDRTQWSPLGGPYRADPSVLAKCDVVFAVGPTGEPSFPRARSGDGRARRRSHWAVCSDSEVAPAEALVGPQDPNFEIFGNGINEPRCGTGLVTAGGSRSAGSC